MDRDILIKKLFQKDHLLKIGNPRYKKIVDELFTWLINCDHAENDETIRLLENKNIRANILSKQDLIIAGIEELEYFLSKFPKISFNKKVSDGVQIKKGETIAVISGDNKTVLALERTILNIAQRMSGIATQTRMFAEKLKPVAIAATRKTPWMLLDKKAVAVGGGLTHRLDLSDGILIKDNHLESISVEYGLKTEAQAIIKILNMALSMKNKTTIEIEVNTKEGASAAIETFLNRQNNNDLIIMLDNWHAGDVKKFVKKTQEISDRESILFEASGNINETNLKDWAKTGVDVISSGALTHSVKAADISLDFNY